MGEVGSPIAFRKANVHPASMLSCFGGCHPRGIFIGMRGLRTSLIFAGFDKPPDFTGGTEGGNGSSNVRHYLVDGHPC